MNNIQLWSPYKLQREPRITEAEWDSLRPYLIELHQQGLKRKELILRAREERGFRASESALNRKFDAWGLTKHHNKHKRSASAQATGKPSDLPSPQPKPYETWKRSLTPTANFQLEKNPRSGHSRNPSSIERFTDNLMVEQSFAKAEQLNQIIRIVSKWRVRTIQSSLPTLYAFLRQNNLFWEHDDDLDDRQLNLCTNIQEILLSITQSNIAGEVLSLPTSDEWLEALRSHGPSVLQALYLTDSYVNWLGDCSTGDAERTVFEWWLTKNIRRFELNAHQVGNAGAEHPVSKADLTPRKVRKICGKYSMPQIRIELVVAQQDSPVFTDNSGNHDSRSEEPGGITGRTSDREPQKPLSISIHDRAADEAESATPESPVDPDLPYIMGHPDASTRFPLHEEARTEQPTTTIDAVDSSVTAEHLDMITSVLLAQDDADENHAEPDHVLKRARLDSTLDRTSWDSLRSSASSFLQLAKRIRLSELVRPNSQLSLLSLLSFVSSRSSNSFGAVTGYPTRWSGRDSELMGMPLGNAARPSITSSISASVQPASRASSVHLQMTG